VCKRSVVVCGERLVSHRTRGECKAGGEGPRVPLDPSYRRRGAAKWIESVSGPKGAHTYADRGESARLRLPGTDPRNQQNPNRRGDLHDRSRHARRRARRGAVVHPAVRSRRGDAFQGVPGAVRHLPARRRRAHAVAPRHSRSRADCGPGRDGGSFAGAVSADDQERGDRGDGFHPAGEPRARDWQVHVVLRRAAEADDGRTAARRRHCFSSGLRRRAHARGGTGAPQRGATAICPRRRVDGHVGLGPVHQRRALVGEPRTRPRAAAGHVRRNVRKLRARCGGSRARGAWTRRTAVRSA
jgi:hypothetical protein